MTEKDEKAKTKDEDKKEVQEEEILKDDFDSVVKTLLEMPPEPKKKSNKRIGGLSAPSSFCTVFLTVSYVL